MHVVAAEGWHRQHAGDETWLPWVNPSPNIRCLNEALLYPGIGLLETTNVSVGRGTDTPFERVGAPWIDGIALARRLNAARIPGIRFTPVCFTPISSVFAETECQGVHLAITERHLMNPLDVGLEIAVALRELYPDTWQVDKFDRLLGNRETLRLIREPTSVAAIRAAFTPELDAFKERRAVFLLYP